MQTVDAEMPDEMMSGDVATPRQTLANPMLKGELRTRLDRLLKLGTERANRRDGEVGRPEANPGTGTQRQVGGGDMTHGQNGRAGLSRLTRIRRACNRLVGERF